MRCDRCVLTQPAARQAVLFVCIAGRSARTRGMFTIVPEENREDFLRDCGHIGNEGVKDTCQIIIYCQSYDAAAYERMGCKELLRKSTSPALLDLAKQERRSFEYDKR